MLEARYAGGKKKFIPRNIQRQSGGCGSSVLSLFVWLASPEMQLVSEVSEEDIIS